MFRKTWKTLKFFIIQAIILICLPHSILPHAAEVNQQDELDMYLKQNDSELRLSEFKDTPGALKLKIAQLDIINKSRKKYNADPVKLDILASRVANKMSKDAAENNYTGHWNMAGEKPYHRYGLAGGYDHISENAFGEWSSEIYQVNDEKISSLMKTGHASFMSERSPNDGHKKNIIEKSHNYVGIGFCLKEKQFRYYEEFIDRYFEFENIPSEVRAGEPLSITLKTDGRSFLYFLIVYYEKFPSPLTPVQISRKGSYNDFTDKEYKTLFAWDLDRYRNGTLYTIPLSFAAEGLYYIQVYTDKKNITKPGAINTKGKIPYSGIVIKVTGE
jgi:uncharacterized protein YkwD